MVQSPGGIDLLRTAPKTAIGLFVYLALALLPMHAVRPDYAIIDQMISDYAVGPFGWIMTYAFISIHAG